MALNETFAATKAQTAASSKNDNFGVTLPTGLPNILTGGYDKNAAGLNAGTARSFAGSGTAAQSNSLTGLLTVTVTRVFDNGNMEIAGQKKLTLNNGDEYVRLTGLIPSSRTFLPPIPCSLTALPMLRSSMSGLVKLLIPAVRDG